MYIRCVYILWNVYMHCEVKNTALSHLLLSRPCQLYLGLKELLLVVVGLIKIIVFTYR